MKLFFDVKKIVFLFFNKDTCYFHKKNINIVVKKPYIQIFIGFDRNCLKPS
jgi:hypothetical protein